MQRLGKKFHANESNQQQTLVFDVPVATDNLPGRLRVVALAEMTRRRRLLGEMTNDQERAVEAVLLLAVEKISERIAEITRICGASVDSGASEEIGRAQP